jgi:hypothetical protein
VIFRSQQWSTAQGPRVQREQAGLFQAALWRLGTVKVEKIQHFLLTLVRARVYQHKMLINMITLLGGIEWLQAMG